MNLKTSIFCSLITLATASYAAGKTPEKFSPSDHYEYSVAVRYSPTFIALERCAAGRECVKETNEGYIFTLSKRADGERARDEIKIFESIFDQFITYSPDLNISLTGWGTTELTLTIIPEPRGIFTRKDSYVLTFTVDDVNGGLKTTVSEKSGCLRSKPVPLCSKTPFRVGAMHY